MSFLLIIWKNQWIIYWNIIRKMLRDSSQFIYISTLNDNISIQWFIVIFRLNNDNNNFIYYESIITTRIVNLWIKYYEMNSQLCIICNSFDWISPKLDIRIDLSKDCIQQLKNIELQIWVSFMPKLQLLLSKVKYINLCKTRSFIERRKKIVHKMIKSTLNSKDIDSHRIHSIDDDSIEFDIERDERYRIIIWSNVLLKMRSPVDSNDLSIGIDMGLSEKNSQGFRNIVCNRQCDSALWTTHRKFRIIWDEPLSTLLFSMKSIAVRAANNCQKRDTKRAIRNIHGAQWVSNIHQRIKGLTCK